MSFRFSEEGWEMKSSDTSVLSLNFAAVTEWKLSSSLYPVFSQNVQRPEYEKYKEKRDSKLQIMALV